MSAKLEHIDKYTVLGELGRGAMGTVFKAQDPMLGRLVAIKMMSDELLIEDEMRGRFLREAKSAANLQHPNIVTIFEFGELEGAGLPYIVMELLDGVALSQLMESGRPERLEDKLHIMTQICRGLDYAHKRGVVHRDVKPGNIQVLPSGIAKVLDFGIAQAEGSGVKTKTGLVMGTPNYMAPEQISGENMDHRADMWAVGVILYELLTGERPFTAPTVPSLVYRIVHASPPPLDARKLGLPEGLVEVIRKVLSKKPNERYRDLSEMAVALDRVVGKGSSEGSLSADARARGYETHISLARSLLQKEQPQRALEAARRAQALEPAHESVVDLLREIEVALNRMQTEETIVPSDSPPPPDFDAARWVDEARMALTGGNRSEALRIVNDVLAVDSAFAPAVELRELLDRPARPGQPSTGSRSRTYRRRVRTELSFAAIATFGEAPGNQVLAMGPHPDHVAAGGVDGSIRLWDIDARSKVGSFRTALHQRAGHEALVTTLAFSPDGKYLASGHVDGQVHLWNVEAFEEVAVRMRHDASVGQVSFSPDGKILASGGLDSTLKLWDVGLLELGDAQRRLIRQPAGVTSLVFSADGSELITGHTNRIHRVHDAATGRLTATLRGHGASPTATVLSPDGAMLASGARDCVIRLFDLKTYEEIRDLTGHKKAITSVSFFPLGNEIASVSMDNSIVIWDVATGQVRTTLWGDADDVFAAVIATGEEPLIVGALADGRLRLWAPEG